MVEAPPQTGDSCYRGISYRFQFYHPDSIVFLRVGCPYTCGALSFGRSVTFFMAQTSEQSEVVLLEGTVMRASSGTYEVDIPEEGPGRQPLICNISGKLKKGRRFLAQPVSVGDRVKVRAVESSGANARGQLHREGNIESILPRRTVLGRSRYNKTDQVTMANLDQVVIVLASREPDLNPHRLDRFLVLAEANDLGAVICFNKVDLLRQSERELELDPLAALYRSLGYTVLLTSAHKRRDLGKAELEAALRNKISAFIGSSGVGKSSLVMMIQPDLLLWVADVMEIGKGRHTTTDVSLHPLECGGYIADTPGVKTIALLEQQEVNLEHCFPELRSRVGHCKFNDCTHLHEPGCLVRDAVDAGEIAASRYESYSRLMVETEAQKPKYQRVKPV